MAADRKTDLADPSAALASYLDDLLFTATSTVVEADVETEVETEVEAVGETVREEFREVAVDKALTEVVGEADSQNNEQDLQSPPPAEPEGRPAWSEKPFECLIFRVAGLQLAVPLVLLGAIHRIEGRVKPIPGRPAWYMGMLPDRGHNLKVVDSAQWIMAGRAPGTARDGYRFVIRLDDSEWALACDEVAESFTLSPDEVRWRSVRSKRPWLAGTVVRHMCALIDVGAMARLLARAEREQVLELE